MSGHTITLTDIVIWILACEALTIYIALIVHSDIIKEIRKHDSATGEPRDEWDRE